MIGDDTTVREGRLAETFVTLADTLVNGFDVTDLLATLSARCVELLGVDAAGIMLAEPGGTLRVVGSSDERMRLLELFELQAEEGPCLDCHASGRPVRVADLADTDRWPRFTPRARSEGFVAVDALPLRLRDHHIGAINLFGTEPGGMPADDLRLAQALGDVAAIGLVQERLIRESEVIAEQLQTALNSRVTIEQAKGILAEQTGLSVDEAFERIRGHARSTNRRLKVVAEQVIAGQLASDQLV